LRRALFLGNPLRRLRGRSGEILCAALIAFYAISVVRFAWVGDDAFITLRTVDNCGRGYGLTWNVNERVQAYTHPLWMLLLLAAHMVTRELYFATVAVGFLVSMAAVLLLALRVARSTAGAAVALAALCCSRAFIDYSTSGLENPLTHLLLVAFFAVWAGESEPERKSPKRLFLLSAITWLAACNRMDTLLLFAPALLVAGARDRSRRGLAAIALGVLPFLAWEIFSIVYYGFPFPNTAYAKLNTGIPRWVVFQHGLTYVADGLSRDPATHLAIAAAALSVVAERRFREVPFIAGVALYLVYVVSIGGDFMSGRFFTGPLVVAAMLLSRSMPGGALRPALQRIGLFVFAAMPANLSGWLDGPPPSKPLIQHGIADERRFYFGELGLSPVLRGQGRIARLPAPDEPADVRFVLRGMIGVDGVLAGPKAHIIDVLALTDPLLAQLPCHRTWRVGHYGRVVPWGYLETLQTGRSAFKDMNLSELYEKLTIVTQGPLFSRRRWIEIWRLNAGAYDHLVDRELYSNPPRIDLTRSDLPAVTPVPGAWDAPGSVLLYRNGARVSLGQIEHAKRIEITVGTGGRYSVALFLGKERVQEQTISTRAMNLGRRILVRRVLTISADAVSKGYDAIDVIPLDENGESSLAALRLRD
jgi:arabinofuranosyltransferase